ncbi:hypothetical protein, partial [Aeromonas hydrophila]|uniref:hypothetical protein n=1 Tax=Aeromonas hydrophila TaxID=644 RepID=UPI0036DCA878
HHLMVKGVDLKHISHSRDRSWRDVTNPESVIKLQLKLLRDVYQMMRPTKLEHHKNDKNQ